MSRKLLYWLVYLPLSSLGVFLLLELALALAGVKALVEPTYPDNPGEYVKIAIFGESSARGHDSERAFEDVLRHDLPARFPGRKFYIRNYARHGFTFHGHQAEIIKANIDRYDFFLIYAGHNEGFDYIDRIGYFRKPEFKGKRQVMTMPGDEMSRFARLRDGHSRVYAVIRRWFDDRAQAAEQRAGGSQNGIRFKEFDTHPVLPPEERRAIDGHMRADLEQIARLAERAGKQVLVASIAGHEAMPPAFSVRAANLAPEKDRAWRAAFEDGRARYSRGDFKGAIAPLEKALKLDPGVAVVSYLLGMSYRQLGMAQKSHEFLRAAKDSDGWPGRAMTSLFEVEKDIASKSGNLRFLDVNKTFYQLVDGGVPLDDLMADLQHPALLGHIVIAHELTCAMADLPPLKGTGTKYDHCNDMAKADWKAQEAYYRQNLNFIEWDVPNMLVAKAWWNMAMSDVTAYPEPYLEIARKCLDRYFELVGKYQIGRDYHAVYKAKLDARLKALEKRHD